MSKLEIGSLVNVELLAAGWHGAEVTGVSEDGKLYSVKLLEASDGYEVGQELGGFHVDPTADYFGDAEAPNIKAAEVYIMRADRTPEMSWWQAGESIGVSHSAKSLPAAVGSLLTCWEVEGRRSRGEHTETPEAAAALLTGGRYWSADKLVTYWFRFTGQ